MPEPKGKRGRKPGSVGTNPFAKLQIEAQRHREANDGITEAVMTFLTGLDALLVTFQQDLERHRIARHAPRRTRSDH